MAIELSDAVRKTLAETQTGLGTSCPDVRWIAPEQLHLTVKFLGEVADPDVAGVGHAMAEAARQCEPFRMRTAECGCFPERGPVRIVWTRTREESGLLARCIEAVEAQIEPLGFPREHRPFAAHITIGRVKDDRSRGLLRTNVEKHRCNEVEQEVRSLTLMASKLSPKGSIYTPMSRVKLGAV